MSTEAFVNLAPKEACSVGKMCVTNINSSVERKRVLSTIFPESDKKKVKRNVSLQVKRASVAKERIDTNVKKTLAEARKSVVDEVCHEYCRVNT